ncbi:hypothetical protein BC830DRAFT_165319 [Chytriomyces sp. MP71]|nr:hypothetical protein BC830DRAFT_165319 [Chytriomyces sp. MP71]
MYVERICEERMGNEDEGYGGFGRFGERARFFSPKGNLFAPMNTPLTAAATGCADGPVVSVGSGGGGWSEERSVGGRVEGSGDSSVNMGLGQEMGLLPSPVSSPTLLSGGGAVAVRVRREDVDGECPFVVEALLSRGKRTIGDLKRALGHPSRLKPHEMVSIHIHTPAIHSPLPGSALRRAPAHGLYPSVKRRPCRRSPARGNHSQTPRSEVRLEASFFKGASLPCDLHCSQYCAAASAPAATAAALLYPTAAAKIAASIASATSQSI